MTKLSEREIILDKENEQVVSRKEWLGEERNSEGNERVQNGILLTQILFEKRVRESESCSVWPEYWGGQPFPSLADLPNSGIEPKLEKTGIKPSLSQ